MRVVDWATVLSEHRVHYITRGANVSRGEINVQCPWCGSADPSQHMGINLETGWWSCWRNRSQHSGKSPVRLLMRLLRMSYEDARELAGLGPSYVDPEGFDALAARLLNPPKVEDGGAVAASRLLDFEPSMRPILREGRTRKHWDYLFSRGFSGLCRGVEDVDALCQGYGLRAGCGGYWNDRVVIPFVDAGRLVTWTARAISDSTARYKDLDKDSSLQLPKEALFNGDCVAEGGAALVVVEGPLDALKIDFYGRLYGVRAVGLSTNSLSDAQAFSIVPAQAKFAQVLVMMDDADGLGAADTMRMCQQLAFVGARPARVPYGLKDAGEMSPRQALNWAQTLAKGDRT